jgi:hypothetical protein
MKHKANTQALKTPSYEIQELAIPKTPKANFSHENSPPFIRLKG